MQYLGWLGTFLLVSAGVYQVRKVLREGHARGVAWGYLASLWLGFLAMIAYTIGTQAKLPLILSYCFQLVVFSLMAWRKAWPRSLQ